MNEIKNKDRRDFLTKAAVAGVAIGVGTNIFGAANKPNIACKG
ncbi:twin-arginine translocation signal domain-containing protein [Campylobacter lanienae]|nr:twin-arginine translocation signal domain-containing protein [Campylobacter lanienae]MDY5519025.1 twin-arginine translocation signal domain-containing protein [Campylobacter lanienae]